MYHPILLLLGFWYIFPAYVANGFAVFSSILKSSHQIDGGRLYRDGRPILGGGKSWERFFIGFLSGALFGVVQYVFAPVLLVFIEIYLPLPVELISVVLLSIPFVFVVALGAMVGDLIGSFIKRRLNINRGRPAPGIDQLDFLIVAILFGVLVLPLPIIHIIFLIVITPIFHLLANFIGYLLRLKEVPW